MWTHDEVVYVERVQMYKVQVQVLPSLLNIITMSKFFSAYYKNQFLWVRVFGYGLHFKNINRHQLTFSERDGITKRVQIGCISIKYLPKQKLPY